MRSFLVAVMLSCLSVAGCTPDRPVEGSPSPTSAPPSPQVTTPPPSATRYEALVAADRPFGYWPMSIGTTVQAGGTLPAVGAQPAIATEGAIRPAAGPTLVGQATGAARFDGLGRALLPVREGLTSRHAFTIELWFQPGPCNGSYGRIAGTEAFTQVGRQGLSFFHYPRQARAAVRCRLGIELWERNRFVVGCPGAAPAVLGRWTYMAVSYSPAAGLTCQLGQRAVRGRGTKRPPYVFEQVAELGAGGSGGGIGGTLATGSVAHVAVYRHQLTQHRLALHARAGS